MPVYLIYNPVLLPLKGLILDFGLRKDGLLVNFIKRIEVQSGYFGATHLLRSFKAELEIPPTW